MRPAGLTCRLGGRLVSLLVGADPPAVQQRVQRLLLAAAGQAAEPLHARPGVDPARLAVGERAREAAAAAGLLDQLAADRHGGAHGQRLLVAGLAGHEGAPGAGHPQDERDQEAQTPQHVEAGALNTPLRGSEEGGTAALMIIRSSQSEPRVFIQELRAA